MKNLNRKRNLLFLGLSILLLDQLTKFLTHFLLPLPELEGVSPIQSSKIIFESFFGIDLYFTHTINHGAAWGILSNFHTELVLARVFVILGMLFYLLFINRNRSVRIPLVFITAGALGNVADSIFYGHVVDMFNFYFFGYDFPVFNIADSFIFLGVFWLSCICFFGKSDSFRKFRSFDKNR